MPLGCPIFWLRRMIGALSLPLNSEGVGATSHRGQGLGRDDGQVLIDGDSHLVGQQLAAWRELH